MKQKDFASEAGIANSTVSEWKKKKTNPSSDKIMDICAVLGVTPEQLLTGKGIEDVDETQILPESRITPLDMQIIEDIRSMVYIIRGQQVMLDRDLAEIYGYEVKKLNQQVKRNIGRFPEDFMFQLANSEIESVRSQIVTSRKNDFFAGQEGGRTVGSGRVATIIE